MSHGLEIPTLLNIIKAWFPAPVHCMYSFVVVANPCGLWEVGAIPVFVIVT